MWVFEFSGSVLGLFKNKDAFYFIFIDIFNCFTI